MIKREATILAIADGIATLRIEVPNACASCGGRTVCGRTRLLRLPAPLMATPGARVSLVLAGSDLVRGALLAYLLPAVTTLLGAVLLAGAGDLAAVAGALCGLGLGLIAMVRCSRRAGWSVPTFFLSSSGDAT